MKGPLLLPAVLALLMAPAALALATPAATLPPVPQVQQVQVPHLQVPQLPQVAVQASAQAHAAAGPAGASVGGSAAGAVQPPPLQAASAATAQLAGQAVATAGAVAGAGLLTGALLAFAGRWLMPLFSRIEGNQVLDNPVRARVHDAVVQDPGLSLEEVRARAGIAWGTAVHHLRRLEDTGLLVSVAQGARRRYFAANTAASGRRAQVAALAQPTARRVAECVRHQPGVDQSALCAALGLRNPAASKHLHRLAAQGLVLAERDGRHCRYHPTEALHATFGVLEAPVAAPVTVRAPRVPAPA